MCYKKLNINVNLFDIFSPVPVIKTWYCQALFQDDSWHILHKIKYTHKLASDWQIEPEEQMSLKFESMYDNFV